MAAPAMIASEQQKNLVSGRDSLSQNGYGPSGAHLGTSRKSTTWSMWCNRWDESYTVQSMFSNPCGAIDGGAFNVV
eukprot:776134-Pyramimonas_sp.AAC.1